MTIRIKDGSKMEMVAPNALIMRIALEKRTLERTKLPAPTTLSTVAFRVGGSVSHSRGNLKLEIIMPRRQPPVYHPKSLDEFTNGKSEHTVDLLHHFIREFSKVGDVTVEPTKTMIAIATQRKGICYVTQLGKNFIHAVFPFKEKYPDNLCFLKIAQVPGQEQFNHHCRILLKEDVNAEVKKFMKLAIELD